MFEGPFSSPFIIPVAFAFAWVAVTWIRAKYGVAGPRWHHQPNNMTVPPMFEKMVEKTMAERDAEIKALRERIEVLERIITDTHKSSSLSDEIEKLREKN